MEIVFLTGQKIRTFNSSSESIIDKNEIKSNEDSILLIKEYEIIGDQNNPLELPIVLLYNDNYFECNKNGIHKCDIDSMANFIYTTKAIIIRKNDVLKYIPENVIKNKIIKKYVHAIVGGAVLIEDIIIDGFPLTLKQHSFVPVDSIGEERLNNSPYFQILKNKGKIEIVDEDYVINASKNTQIKKSRNVVSSLPVGDVKDFLDEKRDDLIEIEISGE